MYDNTAEVVPFQIRPLRVETGQHRSALAIYRKSAVGQTEKSGLATSKSALPSRTDIVSPACQVCFVPLPDFASNPSWWTPRQVQVPGLVQIAGLGERGRARQEGRREVGLGEIGAGEIGVG